ncbi:hypothetical protein AgCh_016253 [Apium graveolens]
MEKLGGKRKSVWEREPLSVDDISPSEINYIHNLASKRPKYKEKDCNSDLDVYTKIALLKVSPSVAGLVSYSGDEEINQGSGTIIESNDNVNIVLTSANLIRRIRRSTCVQFVENNLLDNLKVTVYTCDGTGYKGEVIAHDFHYNLAAIRFKSETPLATATLAHVDDSFSIASIPQSFQLRAHLRSSNLVPGDKVIAVGRYFAKDFDIMAAHGEYSLERADSEYDCRELFTANCIITRSGDGGPLINYNGEVIGITYYDFGLMPWMPINIVRLWWQHYKRFGEYCRPSLGIEATNLYAADICIMERLMLKFPSVCKGVFIEKVVPGSSADLAGIHANDVIVQCGGKTIQGFIEFFETIWDKVGSLVEVVVIRPGNIARIHLNMHVEAITDCLNRWPFRDYK